MPASDNELAGFTTHGFIARGTSGGQAVGDCPFCGKSKHFYINPRTKLWDCKACGEKGNFPSYLRSVAEMNAEDFNGDKKARDWLSDDRGLPLSAFKGWGIGYDGRQYTLPVITETGALSDLRRYTEKTKTRTTAGCKTYLFGARQFAERKLRRAPVFLCEGEWDAIALQWLLRTTKQPGFCVAVPGANSFKKEWVALFAGRNVYVLYDNDAAGEAGELLVYERLKGTCATLRFLHWPADTPPKFDVRDFVRTGAIELGKPSQCWRKLKVLLQNDTPRQLEGQEVEDEVTYKGKLSHDDVYAMFGKWFHMRNENPLAIMFGTILANVAIVGDPIWLFMVAPPGGMKSALMMALTESKMTHFTSSLSPRSLASGAITVSGRDPSLIPKLDGKVLIVKDFTTILTMHPTARDEIFGQLRDVYDGKFAREFANGVERRYDSKFGILAGVTPNIDAFSSLHAGLGERFLKYRFERTLQPMDEEQRIAKAISNINQEDRMYQELKPIARDFLRQRGRVKVDPVLPADINAKLIALSMVIARMRGVVHRDTYRADIVHSKATYEVGTRMGKQLAKLAYGLCLYYGQKEVTQDIYELICDVGMGSVGDRVEEVVRALYIHTPREDDSLTKLELFDKTERMTVQTIGRVLDDLAMLNIVQRFGSRRKFMYQLTPDFKERLKKSEAYSEGRLTDVHS